MTKKTGKISGGRAILVELQNLNSKACKIEIAGCCLRLLAHMSIQGKKLRKELNDELDVLEKTLCINGDYPPMSAARASLK